MNREKRKTHCFIDYENVHESGFEGVESLGVGDAVTIFISSVSHKISLVVLDTLLRKNCELNIIHTIGTGKNNLDFQLIAEVGYQIGRQANEKLAPRFVIISKDRGYENVVTVFSKRGVEISQCETIAKVGQLIEKNEDSLKENHYIPEWEYAEAVIKNLEGLKLTEAEFAKIDKIFREAHTLAILHDRLAKTFGKRGNHQIYSKLKTLHKQYQKTLPAIKPAYEEAPDVVDFQSDLTPEAVLEVLQVTGPAESLKESVNTEVVELEKVTAEVKKKPRGRRKKPAEVKHKADAEENADAAAPIVPVVEQVAEAGTENKGNPEAGPKADPEAAAETEKPAEKKKRRPGRPRKKNGSSKPAAETNDQAEEEALKTEKIEDN